MLHRAKRTFQRMVAQVASFLESQKNAVVIHDLMERGLLVIGRHTHYSPKVFMFRGSECKVEIGSFCSVGPGVQIIAGGIHPPHWLSTFALRIRLHMDGAYEDGMPETRGDIVIGSDVWLGTDSVVLSGVTIGHGAIVAARSVVTRSVPPYAIVAGNPAKIVKYRFEPHIVDQLLKIAWWDWSDEKVREAVPLLSSPDAAGFLEKYEAGGQG